MAARSRGVPGTGIFRFTQSDHLLRKVLESSSVGTALAGRDGIVVYVNAAWTAMTGCGAGGTLYDIPHADDVSRFPSEAREVMEGLRDEFSGECRMRRPDGRGFWAATNVSAVRNDAGEATHTIVQITDIDRIERAEARVAETEQRWNAALEGARQGVWDYDKRTGRTFYSRMWRIMRGYGPDETVDDSREGWLSRIHPEDRARLENSIGYQNNGRDGFDTIEYRERHKLGHWIWILSRGKPVEWRQDGQAVRTIGTDTDITAIKEAEAALAAEKDLLSTTLKAVADGMISTDSAGTVTFMNPSAERLVGKMSRDAIGQAIGKVMQLEDHLGKEIPVHPVVACIADGVVVAPEGDHQLVSEDGRRIDVRFSAAPVLSPDGVVVAAVVVFQDMTYSKTMQKELEHAANHDSLTGLGNRVAFERALATASPARRHAVCFVDLDRFKTVNDTAGHAAGDAVLVQVAAILRASCRESDMVARIGGDEFAFLMTGCSIANARRGAQKLVEAISSRDFIHDGQVHRVGASIGVTHFDPASERPATVMARADMACYAAKSAGRNRVGY